MPDTLPDDESATPRDSVHRKALEIRAELPADPDAARDVTVFATTDAVDSDNEVVLPGGADLSRFEKNPVLLLCHSMGQPGTYGLPIGQVVGLTRRPRGILAGLRFSRDTQMGRDVKALFDEGCLRAVSIGFVSLESSLMTREEAESRPDWQAAYERTKGRVLVHRRWLLLEVSVVGVPANPEALRVAYAAKGLSIPSWLHLPEESPAMPDPVTSAPDGGAIETKSADSGAVHVVPFKSCKDISQAPWNGDEDIAKIRKHCSSDGTGHPDTIDFGRYKEFFTFVRGDEKNVSSYHSPHHTVEGGKMVLLRHKLGLCVAELHGGRAGGLAVPESDLSGITSHLRKHYEEDLQEPFPEGKPSTQNATGDKSVKCPGDPECKDADGDGDEVTEAFKPGDHVRHKKSKMCGEVKSIHTKGRHLLGHDEMDDDDREEVEASEKSPVVKVKMHDEECKCAGPMSRYIKSDLELMPEKTGKALSTTDGGQGGYVTDPTTGPSRDRDAGNDEAVDYDDETGEDGDDEGHGFKKGDPVHVRADHFHGKGIIKSIHHRGVVPDTHNDLIATPDEPAARIQTLKKSGDGHVPSALHVAAHLKHIKRLTEMPKPPSKGKTVSPTGETPAPARKSVKPETKVDPLPPLVALTDEQIQQEALKQIMALPKIAISEIERRMGCV